MNKAFTPFQSVFQMYRLSSLFKGGAITVRPSHNQVVRDFLKKLLSPDKSLPSLQGGMSDFVGDCLWSVFLDWRELISQKALPW